MLHTLLGALSSIGQDMGGFALLSWIMLALFVLAGLDSLWKDRR